MAVYGRIRVSRFDAPHMHTLHGQGGCPAEAQRAQTLDAPFGLAAERDWGELPAQEVSARVGASERAYVDLSRDREGCFLAAFDRGIDELALAATPAWRSERGWAARIRACLAVLLAHLDENPALARLLFVDALGAGPRLLARRAAVLGELAEGIDAGRLGHAAPREIPPIAAEGAVGAAFALIHARLCDPRHKSPLADLLNPLMATIVLPYRGPHAARRELAWPAGGDVGRPTERSKELLHAGSNPQQCHDASRAKR